jgi:trimeric autotransporter adhesin
MLLLSKRLFTVQLALITALTAFGQNYTISTFAGGYLPVNVPGPSASLMGSPSVAVDKAGNIFFVDQNDILRLDSVTSIVTLVAGNGTFNRFAGSGPATSTQLNFPHGIAVDSAGILYFSENSGAIRKVSNGVLTTLAQINSGSAALAVDAAGNVYATDVDPTAGIISFVRKITPSGVITTIAGTSTKPQGFGGDNGLFCRPGKCPRPCPEARRLNESRD